MDLAKIIQSNKNRYSTDKTGGHTYDNFYNKILEELSSRTTNPNILEIGISSGGSIRLWGDLFPTGKILGIDVVTSYNLLNGDDLPSNVEILITDAYSDNCIKKVQNISNTYDLIIDDGPHTVQSQIECIKKYCSLVAPNGYLIIEDIISQNYDNMIRNVIPEGFSIDFYDNRNKVYADAAFILRKI